MTGEEALLELKKIHGQVTSQIIKDLIADHNSDRNRMISLYKRYCASKEKDGVPIFNREFDDKKKVNNKLNHAFDSDIVDTKVGYFAGLPIVYKVDENERLQNEINTFRKRNNLRDKDSETVKMAAICGYAARLLYIDHQGKERVMNVDPWECIFVHDRSVDEPQYALRYYDISVQEEEKWVRRKRVEWYDDKDVTFYIENKEGIFILDGTEEKNPKPHLFGGVPLIQFKNNDECQSDSQKVLELIDAYDRATSDVNSEIEQLRLAYMYFKGVILDDEALAAALRTGAFELDEESDVGFITKDLNDAIIEHHLSRLEKNINRFAKNVNFTDESFGGNLSGIAIRYKIMGLEHKCVTLENKFTTASQRQYQLLCHAWSLKSIAQPDDYLDIEHSFTRNLPVNLQDEAKTSKELKGCISEETRLSLLPFVSDPKQELERMRQDEDYYGMNLDNPSLIDEGGGMGA